MKRISLGLAVVALAFSSAAASAAATPKQANSLRELLPCKAPDGEYPFIVVEDSAEKKIAFVLKCDSEGEPWKLLLPPDKPEQPESEGGEKP